MISGYLNNLIYYAPKGPLQFLQREWLINETINNIENSEYSKCFKIDDIKKEWGNYLLRGSNSSFHIWQLVSFNLNCLLN